MNGDLKLGVCSEFGVSFTPSPFHRERVNGERAVQLCNPQFAIRNSHGFTYIAVMVLVVVMGITLSMTGRYWSTIAKRDREEELLFRGDQMRRGIEMYYQWTAQKHGGAHGGSGIYPESLEELLKSKYSASPKRFLRRIYKDPVTGEADWVTITDPSKRIIGLHSASDEEPLKTSNFPLVYRQFEGKTKYSDWIFAYSPQAQAQPQPSR